MTAIAMDRDLFPNRPEGAFFCGPVSLIARRAGPTASRFTVLAKQILLRTSKQRARRPRLDPPIPAANQSCRDIVDFPDDESGSSRKLIGDSNDRRAQRVAELIPAPAIIGQRTQSRHTDGDLDQPVAPGSPKGIGNDDADINAGATFDLPTEALGRGIGVVGQKRGPSPADIGLIHPRIGAHQPLRRFHDKHASIHPQDAHRVPEYEFDKMRIFSGAAGDGPGEGRGLYVRQLDDPTFGFGDDLLCDDQDIRWVEINLLVCQRGNEQRRQIVTGFYVGYSVDADDLNRSCHRILCKKAAVVE